MAFGGGVWVIASSHHSSMVFQGDKRARLSFSEMKVLSLYNFQQSQPMLVSRVNDSRYTMDQPLDGPGELQNSTYSLPQYNDLALYIHNIAVLQPGSRWL